MGRRAGTGGRPGVWGMSSSIVTSAISTNSRSNNFFTTLVDSEAAGLKGPGVVIVAVSFGCMRVSPGVAEAAAASNSRPVAALGSGVNVGIELRVAGFGGVPSIVGVGPVGGGGGGGGGLEVTGVGPRLWADPKPSS